MFDRSSTTIIESNTEKLHKKYSIQKKVKIAESITLFYLGKPQQILLHNVYKK